MQSKVISDILTVEDRAEQIVADANKVARDTLADADAQAADIIKKTVAEEQAQGRKAVAEAEAQVAQSLQAYEDELKKNDSLETTVSPADIDVIADKIVSRVCLTVFQGRGGLLK